MLNKRPKRRRLKQANQRRAVVTPARASTGSLRVVRKPPFFNEEGTMEMTPKNGKVEPTITAPNIHRLRSPGSCTRQGQQQPFSVPLSKEAQGSIQERVLLDVERKRLRSSGYGKNRTPRCRPNAGQLGCEFSLTHESCRSISRRRENHVEPFTDIHRSQVP